MTATEANRPASPPGKAQVVRGVIRGLLRGRWNGGDRLTEVKAADLFQVSRTPVREALLELAAMGIVELRRNCGAVFLPFGPQELKDIYAVRSLLEVEAARRSVTRTEASLVVRLQHSFEALRKEGRADRHWRLDRELHSAIARSCGNPRLAGEIARYGDLVQTVREAVGGILSGIQSTSLAEHLQILRCFIAHDAEAAGEAMRLHLAQAAESATTALLKLRSKR